MGFSREGRSWAKGDRKNTHVKKYQRGCHGNAKNRLSGHISPGKQGEILAAFSSGVYGPRATKLCGKVKGMWKEFNRTLVSVVTKLLLRKLKNAPMTHKSASCSMEKFSQPSSPLFMDQWAPNLVGRRRANGKMGLGHWFPW